MMRPDAERELLACIEILYDAAAGHVPWLDVGAHLRRLFAADGVGLFVPEPIGPPRQLLAPPSPGEAAYAAYYHTIDPFRLQARRDFSENLAQHHRRAKLGPALVPDQELLASEYYADYARIHGRRHMLGGMLGTTHPTPLSLARGESAYPFTEEDRRRVEMLLPHLQRALDLQGRLAAQETSSRTAMTMLDTLTTGMIIVDGGMRVRFVNAVGLRDVSRPGSGMAIQASGPRGDGSTHLVALHRDDARGLRQLVIAAARGGSGGAMRIRPRGDDPTAEPPMQAVLVSPLPGAVLLDADPGLRDARGLVVVVVEDLAVRTAPDASVLCDVFGLTRSEAAVATGLVGGASAEDVAMAREVSLETVRTQVRAILRKSEANNLRDLERMIARLATVAPRNTRVTDGQRTALAR